MHKLINQTTACGIVVTEYKPERRIAGFWDKRQQKGMVLYCTHDRDDLISCRKCRKEMEKGK